MARGTGAADHVNRRRGAGRAGRRAWQRAVARAAAAARVEIHGGTRRSSHDDVLEVLDRGVKGLEVIIFFDFYQAANVEKIAQGSERGKIVIALKAAVSVLLNNQVIFDELEVVQAREIRHAQLLDGQVTTNSLQVRQLLKSGRRQHTIVPLDCQRAADDRTSSVKEALRVVVALDRPSSAVRRPAGPLLDQGAAEAPRRHRRRARRRLRYRLGRRPRRRRENGRFGRGAW